MSTKRSLVIRGKMTGTVLATMAWWLAVFGWMALAWRQVSFFQGLIGLGITTLLFAAIIAVLWVVDWGLVPIAVVLVTLGWLSFGLYWIGFVWSRHSLLLNCAILILSFLAYVVIVAGLWLVNPGEDCC